MKPRWKTPSPRNPIQPSCHRTGRISGPVQLTLGAYAGVAYDDNVNESQTDVESDVISRGGVNLGFNWPATDHSQLQFGTSVGYLHYLKETANNGLEITPDSALTYALSVDDVIFTFYDQFSYSRQVKTEPALANVATLPQFANTIGAQAEWDPGKWTFQASYGRSINFSDSSNDYLNSSSDNFFGQAGWRFAESTQAGIQASASQNVLSSQQPGQHCQLQCGRVPPMADIVVTAPDLERRSGDFHLQFAVNGRGKFNAQLLLCQPCGQPATHGFYLAKPANQPQRAAGNKPGQRLRGAIHDRLFSQLAAYPTNQRGGVRVVCRWAAAIC